TLTFDQCPSEQGEVSGTVTLAPVVNQTGTATFDLTVDEEPASGSNEPYEITGSTSFALTGASDGVHQTGTARVEQGLSRINLQTDLTYPVGPTSSDQRIPEGTVQANYQTLGLTLLRVTLEFDGDNTVAVDVNGQDFSYDITTGQLT
ncbi:MAG TPA: hypothetical protein VEI97_15205, partial [bacterium]|nr:hypothetical protein [bacterium]